MRRPDGLARLIRLTLRAGVGQASTHSPQPIQADNCLTRFAVLQRQAAYRVVTAGLHAGAVTDTAIGSEAHFRRM